MPLLGIVGGGVFLDGVGQPANEVGGCGGLPAVAFHGAAVLKFAIARRISEFFHFVFELVDSEIEVEIVHVADVDMDFAAKFGAESRPVGADIVAKIVTVIAHVVGDRMIDCAGAFVPQGLGIAVVADGAESGFPDFDLLAGTLVGA